MGWDPELDVGGFVPNSVGEFVIYEAKDIDHFVQSLESQPKIQVPRTGL